MECFHYLVSKGRGSSENNFKATFIEHGRIGRASCCMNGTLYSV